LPFARFSLIIALKSSQINEGGFLMGKPKKQTSPRKTGLRRSHLSLELKRKVNGLLSKAGKKVKVATTKRETAKKKASK
jgi:ribosomal protein L32